MSKFQLFCFSLVAIATAWAASRWLPPGAKRPTAAIGSTEQDGRDMVRVPGGTFRMGNDLSDRPDERPAHDVTLRPFRMDRTEVTNRQFAEFIRATGHVTTAQRQGWSWVLGREGAETGWVKRRGADWLHPGGPDTSLDGRDDHPVVHISWFDATAYARWAGKRLPTEAQWESAARGGLRDADFPWGSSASPDGRPRANTWQGWFPEKDTGEDGFRGLAPVAAFELTGPGLSDMSGNAWEWCADRHAADYYDRSPTDEPTGPSQGNARACRGGAWTTSSVNGSAATVFLRAHRPPDHTSQDLGFRCVEAE